jgi:hypothetical protein
LIPPEEIKWKKEIIKGEVGRITSKREEDRKRAIDFLHL